MNYEFLKKRKKVLLETYQISKVILSIEILFSQAPHAFVEDFPFSFEIPRKSNLIIKNIIKHLSLIHI